MAMVVAAIANDGDVMRPYVVDEVRAPNLSVLDRTDPQSISKAISSTTAEELTTMMVATVDAGTATPAQIPGVQVAGKTGTAQSTADGRPTRGSSRSPRPTTPRWPSPCWCSRATPRARRSAAGASAARSPRRSWRR